MDERSVSQEWAAQAEAWARLARTPGLDVDFSEFNWPAFATMLPAPGRATLDLGCGEGRVGALLRGSGHDITGVDTAPVLADLARATGAYREVIVADAARLPFARASFDLVVAFMSLQDMDDAADAVREVARVLRDGGALAAAVVHPVASAHLGRDNGLQRSYFDVQRTRSALQFPGIAFTFHQVHRPLEDWLALVLDAGLQLRAVREPQPSAETVAAHPRLERARCLPAFLHITATKPRSPA